MQLCRGAAGQEFLTRGSGQVFDVPLGSGRVGSGRAGSGLKNSGNFGSKPAFWSLIFQNFLKVLAKMGHSDLFHSKLSKIYNKYALQTKFQSTFDTEMKLWRVKFENFGFGSGRVIVQFQIFGSGQVRVGNFAVGSGQIWVG